MSQNRVLLALVVSSMWPLVITSARAQEVALEADDLDESYGDQGSFELGGNVAASWTQDLFSFDIGPSFGYFPVDNFELSALARLAHLRPADEDEGATSGTFVIEPSYHLPIGSDEAAFVFAGLGLGAGYDGDVVDLEAIPRLGTNILFGRAGVLTPAVRMPVIFRADEAPQVGFAFEMGVGTVF